ncbi:MAG: Crp/Fnr family transcriptional regulator [Deltaproteobacteria bacterium]|nr:Crp/Fnr family transcriptional regulator [Deltaproteobacteria bacterium]
MAESDLPGGPDFAWRKSPLFNFCDEVDWQCFLRVSNPCAKLAGTELWIEGGNEALLVCLISGSLEAVKKTPGWGKPIILAEFLPGATVGELVFDSAGNHSTTLRVVEDARLLLCGAQGAAKLLNDYPATAARLWRGAAFLQQLRLRQANARLATLF